MKIPQSTTHFLLALEAVVLVIVLVLGIVSPITAPEKNDIGNDKNIENNIGSTDENGTADTQEGENAGTEVIPPEDSENPVQPTKPVFAEDVLAKVEEMTLEQKVAQLFIVTPEALTGADRVTIMGNTTKNMLQKYPVGGFVYSSLNFQDKIQTSSMLKALQEYCVEQFAVPMFLMTEEIGGEEHSPLASANGYTVQASPSEIGASADVQKAIDSVKAISKYLKEAGVNMNLAPNADLTAGIDNVYDKMTYSSDSSVAAMMVAETVSIYNQQGILTIMSMFPGKSSGAFMTESKAEWEESAGLVYRAGINAGVNAIMIGNVYASEFTGDKAIPCSMSEKVVKYIRANMQYQGIIICDSLSEDIITSNYTAAQAAVAAIGAGMDMVYCPKDFEEAYQGVLDAVNSGAISEEAVDESVARILTCKQMIKIT